MSQQPERSGAIYDLGYRAYDGARLGRRQAIQSLFTQGLRSAFGLGRRPAAKVAPFVFAALALIPAVVYLGIAALAPADLDLIATYDYLSVIFVILILFVAIVGPEVVGRDLRYRTLSLYFTRPIARDDYAFARLASLAAAALAITLAPQVVLVIGNALAADSAWHYLREEWLEFPRIIVSGAITACYVSSLGLSIACYTPRRSFAMGGVVAIFFLSSAVGGILSEFAGGPWIVLNPQQQVRAATLIIWNRDPSADEPFGLYDLPLAFGAAAMIATFIAATAVVVRRYRKVGA